MFFKMMITIENENVMWTEFSSTNKIRGMMSWNLSLSSDFYVSRSDWAIERRTISYTEKEKSKYLAFIPVLNWKCFAGIFLLERRWRTVSYERKTSKLFIESYQMTDLQHNYQKVLSTLLTASLSKRIGCEELFDILRKKGLNTYLLFLY